MEQVGIALTYKGRVLKRAENGHLGGSRKFEARTNIEMILVPPSDATVQVYENEKGSGSQLRQLKPQTDDLEDFVVYSRGFSLLEDARSGIQGALYPRITHNNTNRLIVVCYEDDGMFEVWEVGLFAQDGEIYFAKQMTRAGWSEDTSGLPKLGERPESLPDPDLPDNVGRVEWFNLFSGCGVVVTNKGPAHIHWGEIEPHEGLFGKLRKLETGEFVVFGELEESSSRHSIPYQIKGGTLRSPYPLPKLPSDGMIKKNLKYLSSSAKVETGPKPLTHSPFADLKL